MLSYYFNNLCKNIFEKCEYTPRKCFIKFLSYYYKNFVKHIYKVCEYVPEELQQKMFYRFGPDKSSLVPLSAVTGIISGRFNKNL